MSEPGSGGVKPLVLIKGSATPEEVAAVVAVLQAAGSSGEAAPPPAPRSEWSAHHRKLRSTYRHGPGGWRSSTLPR